MKQPRLEPRDKHNKLLLDNVHPSDWKNPKPTGKYDLVVLGAGTAGLISASGVAALGGKVALIEKHLMGGDCLNYGCVPSKALIRSARAAAEIQNAAKLGIKPPKKIDIDFKKVMERVRSIRAGISAHDSARRFKDMGVDVYLGGGKFTGKNRIEVNGEEIYFKRAVIATGGRPALPEIEGLNAAGYLTSESVFSLTELPKSLAVIGGGPIGVELAQAFARLGSSVTLLQRSSRLLPRDDADASEILQKKLAEEGVELFLNVEIGKIHKSGKSKIVEFKSGNKRKKITVSEILVSAGRRPNVENMGLESAGVEFDPKAGVKVNNLLRTTNRKIYAAGDVIQQHQFTHTAEAAARIVIQNAFFFGRKKYSDLIIPWTTYTDPEIAHVGITPLEAERKKVNIQTIIRPLSGIDRAVADGETEGFIKVHLKKGSDKILGATIVARHAGEIISEITSAMTAGKGLKHLASVIHPYPTQADAIRQAGNEYIRTFFKPFMARFTGLLIKMRK